MNSQSAAIRREHLIRSLNDTFRTTLEGGTVSLSGGVQKLPPQIYRRLFDAVSACNDFRSEHPELDEHNQGIVDLEGKKFLFKIDYYDRDFRFGAERPENPALCSRMLRVMLAEEAE